MSQKYISHLFKKQMGSQCNLWGKNISAPPSKQVHCYLLNPETPKGARCSQASQRWPRFRECQKILH